MVCYDLCDENFLIDWLCFPAKDMDHVFYMGQIVENAKPFFFEVLNNGYAKDIDHVFHYGQLVEGLNPFGFNGI
jgi:hypothetical protein